MRIERELSTNLNEKVILYIEEPQKSERDFEFSCKIGLKGGGIDESEKIFGIDQMQAMILSIRYLNGFVSRTSQSINPRFLTCDFGSEDDNFGLLL